MPPVVPSPGSVVCVEFSRELRNDVLAGDITVSVRAWKRPQVKAGGRYRVGLGEIEVDAIEVLPFAAISEETSNSPGSPTAKRCADAPHTPDRSTRARWCTGSSFTR